MSQHRGEELADLLHADRELSDAEMERLALVSKQEWGVLAGMLRTRASATYGVADAQDFERCVTQHMSAQDWNAMAVAGIFECPQCSRLLKNRDAPVVATAVLLERRRIGDLWSAVEGATPEQLDARMLVFRRALGLT
jgi:hypothetical protein